MKIFFTNQKNNFSHHLTSLKNRDIIPYAKKSTTHKVSKRVLLCKFSEFPFTDFFNYTIFPHEILTSHCQWIEEKRAMHEGDTIVQQINIPPFTNLSIKVLVGVRIKEIFDESHRKGFSYETLAGHVETGISIFTIEGHEECCIFTIETYSKPSMFLLKLFEPISSLYQNYCTKRALENIKELGNTKIYSIEI